MSEKITAMIEEIKGLTVLELSELVVAVLIADIASIPLQNPSLPLSYGLIPLLVLFCCELIFSGLTYKSIHLRKLLYGRPNFIIERGRIAQQAMHRNRFTLDELTQELRNQGILDIASVEYAVLETNGQLNIILAPAQQPVTAEQMQIETEDTGDQSQRRHNRTARNTRCTYGKYT